MWYEETLVVYLSYTQTLVKEKGKEIEMNFTDDDGLVLTYYDIDLI